MKHNDIDQLLSGLLGGQAAPKPVQKEAPPPPPPVEEPKRSAASEHSMRRVEEIMRRVEQENSMKKAGEAQKRQDMTIPRRDPVPVPPPVSHFTDEPSQNPAVRMRDRLDETALPMLDAERKPNQIIEPKSKPEQVQKPRKKKKRPQNPEAQKQQTQKPAEAAKQASADIPAPQKEQRRTVPHISIPDELPPDVPREIAKTDPIQEEKSENPMIPQEKPKRKIMHINIPDELPPDIPREIPKPVQETPEPSQEISEEKTVVPQEKPKRKIMHINIPDELPPDIPRDTTIADEMRRKREQEAETAEKVSVQHEPVSETEKASDEEFLKKTASLREQIRNAMDEIKAVPDPEDLPVEAAEEQPLEIAAEEMVIPEETPKKSRFGDMFRRRKQEEEPTESEETVPEEITVQEETVEEETEEDPTESEAAAAAETPAAPAAPRLRHLSTVDESKEKQGFFSRFSRKKKQNLTEYEEIDLSENIEIPLEISEESPKRTFFSKREKVALIPDPVEHADVPEDEPEEIAEEVPPQKTAAPKLPPEPEIPAQSPQEPESSIDVTLEEPEVSSKKQGFAAALRDALDADVQELADEKAEPLPPEQPARSPRAFRRRTYLIMGVLCSVFAAIGAVTCIVLAVQAVQRFAASSSLKSKLEDVIYPAAVVDLPEFENPAEAAPEVLLSAAMIDLLMYGDLSQYQEVFDTISIPAEDIHSRAAAMFGIEIANAPETLYAAGEIFFYDESTGSYNVPSSPVIFSYAPDITEIRRSGDEYIVTVVYRSDTAQWQERSENFKMTSEKTMEIALYKENNAYRIARIMNISEHSEGI